ncbi:MAG TPA: DUF2851 family protein [Verrucomicrobiae bacterium]|nr:DUF2851 family protein [Verrucomicrobiae bacterium]
MSTISANFYARWRTRGLPGQTLQEGPDSVPPEFLLQAIWQQQRLRRDQLKTLDGQTVRILHPGFKNHEAGPDFRGAVVQIGTETSRVGDVEIDLRSAGWRAHGHDVNPAFKQVILHVVWDGERAVATGLPVVALRGMLDAPLGELSAWLSHDSLQSLPESLQGKCCAPLRELPPASLTALLQQAAQVRSQAKAHQLAARAREAGWEQALWEGLFRALGYKQNVWAMQRLAELRSRWTVSSYDPLVFQARLFGISGLLPAELTRAQAATDNYLRRVWDQWWREREPFADCILPRELWRFNNLRPANHPQRRIALAAHWLATGDLPARLEKWFTANIPDEELANSLLRTLQVERDEFWSWHWTFRSARLPRPQPMLGAARVTDLAVNVILPWFWMRAAEGKNERLQRVAEHRYLNWPAAEDNSVLKLARQRLLGGMKASTLQGAAAQQGLLQILRDFCEHSNALCENCAFPELVKSFADSAN